MLILIVEDNPMLALDLEEIVRAHVDADVVVSSTVAAAARVLDRPFDFAFFDVDLPDGKTWGLAQAMLARNVPFTFVSGSSIAEMPPCLRGAPFVAKPFASNDIVRALGRARELVH